MRRVLARHTLCEALRCDNWTRQLVPAPAGYNNVVFGMAWIPGTTSVWADGEADPNSGHTVGVIAKFGP